MEIGKSTTVLISILLLLFSVVLADPTGTLRPLLGENIWLNWGLAITAFVIVFGNFLYPSIKEISETGTLRVDNGTISTFFATFLGLIATIGFLYPEAIIQLMNNLGLGQYGASAVYILGMIYNAKYPRNQNNMVPIEQPEEQEPITPEVKEEEGEEKGV